MWTDPVDSVVDALDRVPLRTLTQCQLLLNGVLDKVFGLRRRLGLKTDRHDTIRYEKIGAL